MTEVSLKTPKVPLPIKVRRHEKARNIILRVSPTGKELLLTLPSRISHKRGLAFVHAQASWISLQLAQLKTYKDVPIAPGLKLPLFGKECLLVHRPGQRGSLYTGDRLILGGEPEHFSRRVQDWIKKEARKRWRPLAVRYAEKIGKSVTALTLRDTRSRWGSCSVDGKLSLCWRLALAPADVAHYVIAHEVAHLKHFDHSPAFWRTVGKLHPNWDAARLWLQQKGKSLHRYC